MVRVHFDISLFTMDAAFGMVSGPFEVAVVPQAGDLIDFSLPGACTAFVGERKLPFVGQLRVTDRIIPAKGVAEVMAMLEDITAATREDAQRLLEMFEQEYGLFGDVWEDND
jgi:hypothetical protein